MMEWWNDLTVLNQVLYGAAAFFSLVFIWQFVASLIGMSGGDVDVEGGSDVDVDADMDADGVDLDDIEAHSIEEAGESIVAFRILSVRAILAFFTLFSWAGALYLDAGKSLSHSLVLAVVWGLGAWLFVAVLIHWLRKLAETGTQQLSTCVGSRGTVYLDIPADGQGEVRVTVSGVVSMVRARAAGAEQIKAGTPVQVLRMLDGSSVEVAPVQDRTEKETPDPDGKENDQ